MLFQAKTTKRLPTLIHLSLWTKTKLELVNRRLERSHNLTLGQLNQFVQSNYSTYAIRLYAIHTYPKVFEQISRTQLEKWNKAKEAPNSTIDPNMFIDNPFSFIFQTIGLLFMDLMAIFANGYGKSLDVPMKMCTLILRLNNETEMADGLDAPVKNGNSPEIRDQFLEKRDLYSKATKQKKCPNLPPSYTAALHMNKPKVEELVGSVQNYTVHSCLTYSNKTVYNECDNKEKKDENKIIKSTKTTEDDESEEDSKQRDKAPKDPVQTFKENAEFFANALKFAETLDDSQQVTDAEIEVAKEFYQSTGYPIAARIQQVYVVLLSEEMSNFSISDLDQVMHLFYNESLKSVEEQTAQMFEQVKEEFLVNGTQADMKELINAIKLPPSKPQLQIDSFDDGQTQFTVKSSTGQTYSLNLTIFNISYFDEYIENEKNKKLFDFTGGREKRENTVFNELSSLKDAFDQELLSDLLEFDVQSDQENKTVTSQASDDSDNEVLFKMQEVTNCTFKNPLVNNSTEQPVRCKFNLVPMLDSYNTTDDEFIKYVAETFDRFSLTLVLPLLSSTSVSIDKLIYDEYIRVIQQNQETDGLIKLTKFVKTSDKNEAVNLEFIYLLAPNSTVLIDTLSIDVITSWYDAILRLKTCRFEMPSVNSYDPIRKQLAYSRKQEAGIVTAKKIRYLYAQIRTALVYESERSKLEIYQKLDKYLRCVVRSYFQRIYQKIVKVVEPSLINEEFHCDMPKFTN